MSRRKTVPKLREPLETARQQLIDSHWSPALGTSRMTGEERDRVKGALFLVRRQLHIEPSDLLAGVVPAEWLADDKG